MNKGKFTELPTVEGAKLQSGTPIKPRKQTWKQKRKRWWNNVKWGIQRWYKQIPEQLKCLSYRINYGLKLRTGWGDMPTFGKDRYVEVKQRGPVWDLISLKESDDVPIGILRLTPKKSAHGFRVQYIDEHGTQKWATSVSYSDLYKYGDEKHSVGGAETMSAGPSSAG